MIEEITWRQWVGTFLLAIGVVFMASNAAWSIDLSTHYDGITPATDIKQYQVTTPQTIFQVNYNASDTPENNVKSLQFQTAPNTQGMTPLENIKPVSTTPLPPISAYPGQSSLMTRPVSTMLVLPVVSHNGKLKAFSDLPILISTAMANQLLTSAQHANLGFTAINPIYAFDDVQERGLDGIYQRIVSDYLEAGQPNEKDLSFLADKLTTRNQQIQWVAFVESDFDTNHMTRPTMVQKAYSLIYDEAPRTPNYYVNATVHIFSVQPGVPMLYEKSAQANVKMDAMSGYNGSVMSGDSILAFKRTASNLASKLVMMLPLSSWVTGVAGPDPTLATNASVLQPGISAEDQETLKRIIQN